MAYRWKTSPAGGRPLAALLALALLGLGVLAAAQESDLGQVPGLSREAAQSAADKMRGIQEGSLARHTSSSVRISETEANSYLQYEMASDFPPGVSKARLKFEPGRPQAFAEVDFDKIKEGFKTPPNPLLEYFLRGVHSLGVGGTLSGSDGVAEFHLETVTLDDITLPRMVVDYLIERYLKPRYPDVAINRPFPLLFSIDKLNLEAGSLVLTGRP